MKTYELAWNGCPVLDADVYTESIDARGILVVSVIPCVEVRYLQTKKNTW